MLLSEEDLKISGFELGCSDVPGWGHRRENVLDHPRLTGRGLRRTTEGVTREQESPLETPKDDARPLEGSELHEVDDGTDDYLHRPLPDSNPATSSRKGEPADASMQDRTKSPTHADIESLQESADIAGKVVLLSRGGCGFLEKVKWTQRRGGIALIVGDNERNGPLTIMYAKGDTSNVTIPAIFTSYTSAHLLSSLVPPDLGPATPEDGRLPINSGKAPKHGQKAKVTTSKQIDSPVFTTTTSSAVPTKPTMATRPDTDPAHDQGWLHNVLHVMGLDGEDVHHEDTRRPPSSGNIEWLQVENWDEQLDTFPTTTQAATVSSQPSLATRSLDGRKGKSAQSVHNDDFVIGVQDWRDTEVIAPKPTTSTASDKSERTRTASISTSTSVKGRQSLLEGGSIIPGSGQYLAEDVREHKKLSGGAEHGDSVEHDPHSLWGKVGSVFGKDPNHVTPYEDVHGSPGKQTPPDKHHQDMKEGLWVTLTPASVSASPFFDTLLVLVISPLVTLTFVYGLLLLRSRIRRRRWRAPKSIVDQLPVRTYHTMSSASSTTSSQLPSQQASPQPSNASTPLLHSEPIRVRQRSQTTIGLLSTSTSPSPSPQPEKSIVKAKSKKYKGRQIECVVCLEEYIDGESKVMSLPCGHEFHAECITPWLVNRRRTCPICKGDVVRSLQRASRTGTLADEDGRIPGEETSDDVQDRVVSTVPEEQSLAIPIPRQEVTVLLDEDVERGDHDDDIHEPAAGSSRPSAAARWRGILSQSVSGLSGDTLRSNTPNEDKRR